MHEEKFELLDVVDEELVEPVGQKVAGTLVRPCKTPTTTNPKTLPTGMGGILSVKTSINI